MLRQAQYSLNGLGWKARTIPGTEASPLSRRLYSEDGDVTDSTRHSAGNDIDADSDNDAFIFDCWLITLLWFSIYGWIICFFFCQIFELNILWCGQTWHMPFRVQFSINHRTVQIEILFPQSVSKIIGILRPSTNKNAMHFYSFDFGANYTEATNQSALKSKL